MNNSSFLIIITLLFSSNIYSQQTITLKMCHDSAEVNFPLANQIEKFEQIEQLRQRNLSSKYFPTINFNAKGTYQSEVVTLSVNVPGVVFPEVPKAQYSANIEVNQLIYDGGSINAAQKVSKQNLLVDLQKINVDMYKIKEQINNLYFKCLLLQENTIILKLTYETIFEQKKVLISAVNQGVVLESELDNLNAEILRIEQQTIEITAAKTQVLKALEILSCFTIVNNAQLKLPSIINSKNTSFNRPEYLLFDNQSHLLDASIQLTQKKRMPTLGAFATGGFGMPGYDMFRDDIHGFFLVGAQFQWNVWDWKQTQREQQQLSIKKLIIEDNRELFNKNLSVEISEADLRKQKLIDLIEKDKAIIELQSKIRKRTEDQMNNGTQTSADFIRDLNSEKQARINLESREIQLLQAEVDELTLKGITNYE